MKDTQEELDRLEQELLKDQQIDPEFLSELLEDPEETPEPAFDDPDTIYDPEEPMVYCNYSNDYGGDAGAENQEKPAPDGQAVSKEKVTKDNHIIMGLMIAVSALCAGIIGVLIYWMVVFLR